MKNDPHKIARMVFLLFAMPGAFPFYGTDLIEVYRDGRGSNAVYASARAAWSTAQDLIVRVAQASFDVLLAQATYTYILSLLRLKAAVGRLAEDDLARINAWLER